MNEQKQAPVQPVEVEQVRRWADSTYADNAGQEFRMTRAGTDLVFYTYLTGFKKGRESWAGRAYVEENSTVVTAAPLDRSKVKAGDTVTVRHLGAPNTPMKPFEATGEVYDWGGLHVAGLDLSDPYVTLTAHQPAPEPEPAPPAVVSARLRNESIPDRFWYVDEGDVTTPYYVDDVGLRHIRADLHDVRPLVVIDPEEARESVMRALYEWDERSAAPGSDGLDELTDLIVRTLLEDK